MLSNNSHEFLGEVESQTKPPRETRESTKDTIKFRVSVQTPSSHTSTTEFSGSAASLTPLRLQSETSHPSIDDELRIKKEFKQFLENRRSFLLTSRFGSYKKNNIIFDTWEENKKFREKNPNLGCIYGSPDKIAKTIPIDSILFILEMNNDINKIMGIGMVKNHPITGKYNTYKDGNFNRYLFLGKYRIDREEMTEEEEKIMKAFDVLCFTGNQHLKRGKGITAYPPYMIFKCIKIIDLVEFISNMFKKRFSTKNKL